MQGYSIGGQQGPANVATGGMMGAFNGGGINSILDPAGFFRTPPNAADAGMPYLNQISGMANQAYSPYMQAGQQAMGQLQGQYGQLTGTLPGLQGQLSSLQGQLPGLQTQYGNLMNNPGGTVNQIGSSFHQSPGFNFQVNQAQNAANQAAAAGGMLGSPQHQQNIAGTVNNLANQDYYNYLNTAMGAYGQGLQGSQGLYNQGLGGGMGMYSQGLQGLEGLNRMGYGATNNYANMIANQLGSQASLGYAGQANQNQAQGGMMGNLMGLGGTALAAFL